MGKNKVIPYMIVQAKNVSALDCGGNTELNVVTIVQTLMYSEDSINKMC
jgi:hypothetical protein